MPQVGDIERAKEVEILQARVTTLEADNEILRIQLSEAIK